MSVFDPLWTKVYGKKQPHKKANQARIGVSLWRNPLCICRNDLGLVKQAWEF